MKLSCFITPRAQGVYSFHLHLPSPPCPLRITAWRFRSFLQAKSDSSHRPCWVEERMWATFLPSVLFFLTPPWEKEWQNSQQKWNSCYKSHLQCVGCWGRMNGLPASKGVYLLSPPWKVMNNDANCGFSVALPHLGCMPFEGTCAWTRMCLDGGPVSRGWDGEKDSTFSSLHERAFLYQLSPHVYIKSPKWKKYPLNCSRFFMQEPLWQIIFRAECQKGLSLLNNWPVGFY